MLRRRGDRIGLTTVYRTLQVLADAGEIDVMQAGLSSVIEINKQGGDIRTIGGLVVRPAPASRMPAGVGALQVDSTQLGSLGYEDIPSPEYTGTPDGIQSWARRDPSATDSWLLRTRRTVVPFIQEPNAGIKITGV